MVYIPDVLPEEFAYAQEQIPFYHLAAHQKSLNHIVYNVFGIDWVDGYMFHRAMKKTAAFEYLLHGVHLRAGEDKGAEPFLFGGEFFQDGIEKDAGFAVIAKEEKVLKFFYQNKTTLARSFGYSQGQSNYGLEVGIVGISFEGNHLILICKNFFIKNKRGTL